MYAVTELRSPFYHDGGVICSRQKAIEMENVVDEVGGVVKVVEMCYRGASSFREWVSQWFHLPICTTSRTSLIPRSYTCTSLSSFSAEGTDMYPVNRASTQGIPNHRQQISKQKVPIFSPRPRKNRKRQIHIPIHQLQGDPDNSSIRAILVELRDM
jgi:hypothetical protein